MGKKILMAIIDGLADRSIDGETPLSLAEKPNMDKIVSMGINGIMDTISPGIRPGSDTGHLSLLGYNPFECYSGRGPIEAAGAGIELKKGDIGFRINFGTVDGKGSIFDKTVRDRRAGRISDTDELVKAINEGVKLDVEFIFKRGAGHRGALVLRGGNLSCEISDTDPHTIGEKVWRCKALSDDEKAKRTAEIVNSFMEQSHKILDEHPYNSQREKEGKLKGNAILIRAAGLVPDLPSFEERFGMKLALITNTTLIMGIGKFLKGDVIVPSGSGKETDIKESVDFAIEALKTHDFVLLHFKATDEFGHDGDFEGKKKYIEKLDSYFKPITELDFSDTLLILTADHSTPVVAKEHTADPVPATIVYKGVRVDEVKKLSEFEAYKGGLCRITAIDLLNISIDLIDKAHKFGA